MSIKINATEKTALLSLADDTDTANTSGIVDNAAAPVAATIVPVRNYSEIKKGKETTFSEGIVAGYGPYHRYVGPISNTVVTLNPSFTIVGATQSLLTMPFSDQYEVVRNCMVTLSFSAYSSDVATLLRYWIEVNGNQYTTFKHYFNVANQHLQMGGNWVVALPQNTPVSIVLKATRFSGSGNIVLDSNDFISLSLIG